MATTTTHTSYGAPVSLDIKRTSSSKIRKITGFRYPLIGKLFKATGNPSSLTSSTSQGGYFSKCNGIELIRNNLRQLFLCEKGERLMLPDYGLSLNRFLFEPLDETTYYLIKNEILVTIAKYFSKVNVISLRVFGNPRWKSGGENQIVIQLTLQLLDESLTLFDTEVTIG